MSAAGRGGELDCAAQVADARRAALHRPHSSRLTLEAGYTFRGDAEFNSMQTSAKGGGWFMRAAWGVTLLPTEAS